MLIRGGRQYQCRINVADGKATLSMLDADGEALGFDDADGRDDHDAHRRRPASKGPGSYRLRLSNCDHEMLLWVNGSVVKFDGPTTYPSDELIVPVHSAADPGDLAPAGVGSRGAAVQLSGLRIYRDKYYIATNANGESNDFIDLIRARASTSTASRASVPSSWPIPTCGRPATCSTSTTAEHVEFVLGQDQFLPMGDNSPQSSDGRFWRDHTTHASKASTTTSSATC